MRKKDRILLIIALVFAMLNLLAYFSAGILQNGDSKPQLKGFDSSMKEGVDESKDAHRFSEYKKKRTTILEDSTVTTIDYYYNYDGQPEKIIRNKLESDKNLNAETEIIFTYDDNKNCISEQTRDYRDGELYYDDTIYYSYDGSGKRLFAYTTINEQLQWPLYYDRYDAWGQWMGTTEERKLNLYDRYGTLITELLVGDSRGDEQKIVRGVNALYDESNNLTRLACVSEDYGLVLYYFEYDDLDRIIYSTSQIVYNKTEVSRTSEVLFEYNQDGSYSKNEIIRGDYFRLPENRSIATMYSAEGVVISVCEIDMDTGQIVMTAEYDLQGNEISIVYYENGAVLQERMHKYEYDDFGNAIKCCYYIDGKLISTTLYDYSMI